MPLSSHAPRRVSVYEVGPRDGLQNEERRLPAADKLRLIEAMVDAGLTRVEVTSFVSPAWIPQLADADEVARQVVARWGATRFSGLCPNARGLARAQEAGLEEVAVFLSASETHNQKNVNKTVAETLKAFETVVPAALTAGMRVRAYVSTVWGCPYEGDVAVERSAEIVGALLQLGCYQISLGDTVGCGTPAETQRIVGHLLDRGVTRGQLALHMHDTRGTALANVLAGLDLGIADFDASVGGMGGCPYAPGAAGNLATEDLVYMLQGMGIETGIDLDKLLAAARLAEDLVGRRLPGKVHQAGAFKPRLNRGATEAAEPVESK